MEMVLPAHSERREEIFVMKYCRNPFEMVYIIPGGDVFVCSWNDASVGNMHQESIREMWNGSRAETVRNSIRDQTFRFCRKTSCPYLENDSLPDLPEEEFRRKCTAAELPKRFNIAFDYTCNHACPSCRNRVFAADREYTDSLAEEIKALMPYLQQADWISANGNGDLFANPVLLDMFSGLNPDNPECTIAIETNGVLFDEAHWKKIEHLQQYPIKVTVTPNSFERETYRYLAGGFDDLDRIDHNLRLLSRLRKEKRIRKISISIVVQDSNFRELPDFCRKALDVYHADRVIVKPLYHWFGLSEEDYWYKDILNPLHPYFTEYQEILKDPALGDQRVYFWGAKNIHEACPHPAYQYREDLHILKRMVSSSEESPGALLKKRGIDHCIIYGDTELSPVVLKMLKEEGIRVDAWIAKKPCEKKEESGYVLQDFMEYKPEDSDVFLVVNYRYRKNIRRDLDFIHFKGICVGLDELYGKK